MKRYLILFILIVLFIKPAFSQKAKPLRVEIEVKSKSDRYNIIPVGEEGLILFYDTDVRKAPQNEDKIWYFTKYDNKFKHLWTKEISVPIPLQFKYYDSDKDNIYIFFSKTGAQMNSSKEHFKILTINIKTGDKQEVNVVLPAQFIFNEFKVLNSTDSAFVTRGRRVAYLCGWNPPSTGSLIAQTFLSITTMPYFFGLSVAKIKPAFFAINLDPQPASGENIIKEIPLNYNGYSEVLNLTTNPQNNTIIALIKNIIYHKPDRLYINEYPVFSSEPIASLTVNTLETPYRLNSGKLLQLNQNEKILVGTFYNSNKKPNPVRDFFNNTANGFYITKFTQQQQLYIKYYHFTKLKNFFNYFNEESIGRIQRRIKKSELKGKLINYDYRLLLHPLIQKDDQYILIAELYYPEYRIEYYTTYYYGIPQTYTREIFDGYRYTHAIIAAFDSTCNLLWDNCFEIMDILTYDLKERVKTLFDGETLLLAYSYGGSIKFKVIHKGEVIDKKDEVEIDVGTNKEVKANYKSDLVYWYDNYFISYGLQRVQDEKGTNKTIFYFNKIAFR